MNKIGSNIMTVIIGIVFMLISWNINDINTQKKNSMDSKVQSTKVTHSKHRSRKSTQYISTYHYEVNGEKYVCIGKVSSSSKSYKNKTILYKAHNPRECYVDESEMNLFIYGFFIAGLAIVIYTLFPKNNGLV